MAEPASGTQTVTAAHDSSSRHLAGATSTGYILAFSAYIMWGFFPLYFRLLAPASAVEIIVHRTVWALVCCVIALLSLRRFSHFTTLFRQPRVVGAFAAAGALIFINWTTYVYAVMIGRTVDAALGYYINPLLTVFLGVVVLRERIRPLQWAAIVLGAIAVAIVAIGVGSLPWISLLLAGSFSVYSLVKKRISGSVQPLEGMALETTLMSPFLLVFYGVLLWGGQTSIQLLQAQPSSTVTIAGHVALLVGSGALTVVPLLLFAGASGHLPLGVLGLIQYLSPSIQFILAVWVFGEQMEPSRWAATVVVWLAVVLVSIDMVVRTRKALR